MVRQGVWNSFGPDFILSHTSTSTEEERLLSLRPPGLFSIPDTVELSSSRLFAVLIINPIRPNCYSAEARPAPSPTERIIVDLKFSAQVAHMALIRHAVFGRRLNHVALSQSWMNSRKPSPLMVLRTIISSLLASRLPLSIGHLSKLLNSHVLPHGANTYMRISGSPPMILLAAQPTCESSVAGPFISAYICSAEQHCGNVRRGFIERRVSAHPQHLRYLERTASQSTWCIVEKAKISMLPATLLDTD